MLYSIYYLLLTNLLHKRLELIQNLSYKYSKFLL
nr:MAG TPA: hypothetical protein [Caudoviricetes sp.]